MYTIIHSSSVMWHETQTTNLASKKISLFSIPKVHYILMLMLANEFQIMQTSVSQELISTVIILISIQCEQCFSFQIKWNIGP